MPRATRILISLACIFTVGLASLLADGPRIEVQAFAGKPFGVGKIVITPATSATKPTTTAEAMTRYDPSEPVVAIQQELAASTSLGNSPRVFYPAFIEVVDSKGADLASYRHSDIDPDGQLTAYFLFTGAEPLDLTFSCGVGKGKVSYPVKVTVGDDNARQSKLLLHWHKAYIAQMQRSCTADYYSPQVEYYLANMLGRRLKLPVDQITQPGGHSTDAMEALDFFSGAESVRLAMQKDTLLRDAKSIETADQPLPTPATMPAVVLPGVDPSVVVEPIASHVPQECFYLRCGNFPNFQWLRATADDWGANVRNVVSYRAFDYGIKEKIERQLALRETMMAKLFGDSVVADVAIIGTDTFVREGAAIGIIFQAKLGNVLATQISNQRSAAIKADATVTQKTLDIAGHKVMLLSRPDNAVRSFYAVDGDYHLVTTSRTLVERFYQAGAGKDDLASLKEFKYARTRMPAANNGSLFIYLSDPFFRNLVGPQYRVEMTRRTQSLCDMELVSMATIAAKGEGAKAATIEDLVQGQFLPDTFNKRSDGSTLAFRDGQLCDTVRGGRGTFIPIPDVQITGLTPTEVKAYEEFVRFYRGQWERIDPVMVTINRQTDGKAKTQLVTLDVHITPYAKPHYDTMLRYLGQPSKYCFERIPGDLLFVEAVRLKTEEALGEQVLGGKHLKIVRLLAALRAAPHLFAGVRDFDLPFRIEGSTVIFDEKDIITTARVYAGEKPGPELAYYLMGLEQWRKADAEGYIKATDQGPIGGIFGRTFDGIAVLSLDRKTLETVTPQLKMSEGKRAAQIRIRSGDLTDTKLWNFVNAQGYTHSRRASAGNSWMLQTFATQLHVAPKDCLAAAEQVLGAKLVCPLGGAYKLDDASGTWTSTAWATPTVAEVTTIPKGYRFGLLDFVRGVGLEFSIDATSLTTRIELELKKD